MGIPGKPVIFTYWAQLCNTLLTTDSELSGHGKWNSIHTGCTVVANKWSFLCWSCKCIDLHRTKTQIKISIGDLNCRSLLKIDTIGHWPFAIVEVLETNIWDKQRGQGSGENRYSSVVWACHLVFLMSVHECVSSRGLARPPHPGSASLTTRKS